MLTSTINKRMRSFMKSGNLDYLASNDVLRAAGIHRSNAKSQTNGLLSHKGG